MKRMFLEISNSNAQRGRIAICALTIERRVGCFLLISGFYPIAPDDAAEIAGVFPPEKTALYASLVSGSVGFSQTLRNFERMRVLADNSTNRQAV
jgi:hypothetical protein